MYANRVISWYSQQFKIDGRLTRKPYWTYFAVLAASVLWMAFFHSFANFRSWPIALILEFIAFSVPLLIFIGSIPVVVRRLHDFNISGYGALLWPILAVGSLYIEILSTIAGLFVLIVGIIPSVEQKVDSATPLNKNYTIR